MKHCARCRTLFECKMGDVANCQCNSVEISEEAREFLKGTSYDDCLCRNCMAEIDQMVKFRLQHSFPIQRELMVEGLHYYIDNDYFVFTELYHLQRGYCCGNNCRHCAYGNKRQ